MAHKWIATKFKGIRYRKHSVRMHGRQKDKYFNVRFRVAGESVNEGYGWASEGMSASKAALLLAELKEELRTGKGTGKLSDRRKAKQAELEEVKLEEMLQERMAFSYSQYFKEKYLPSIQNKKPTTKAREVSLHKLWILPAMGRIPTKDIGELHLKKVKLDMEKAGRSPRSVQYAFTCIQMTMSHAIETGFYLGINPVKKLKKNDRPKFDNRRTRFFSHDQAEQILQALKKRSQSVHDMTLLSMHCGLRAGEIFQLIWADIDLSHRLITLRNTKSDRDRIVNMTEDVFSMFNSKLKKNRGGLVFPSKDGKPRRLMSRTFARTVEELGLNDGVVDRKQKFIFHTCRHTCASWLVQAGVPLFTVQKILGHSSIAMTERYSHLSPDGTKAALSLMEQSLTASKTAREKNVVNIR